jgi:formylglycine-generating enzyme
MRWLSLLVLSLVTAVVASPSAEAKPSKRPASKQVLAKKVSKSAARVVSSRRGSAKRAALSERGRRRASSEPTQRRVPRQGPLSRWDRTIQCPEDMVAVAGRFCVDRYEMSLVDDATTTPWPPYFAPDVERAASTYAFYASLEMRRPSPLGLSLPLPPSFAIVPRAISRAHQTPQGFLSADDASRACKAAGKRLCSESEWVTACRGEASRDFPYGARYEAGACNVFRESHPTFLLHRNAARFHDDPRANLVQFEGAPLLRASGETPRCQSRWGEDAIFDMVGNLDEWVESGVFLGGFYSRGTKSGCAARVSNHPRVYSDYSTGARCCSAPIDASSARADLETLVK